MKSNDHFLHSKPFAIACRSPINDNFVVTLPLSGPDCYFRLQAQ